MCKPVKLGEPPVLKTRGNAELSPSNWESVETQRQASKMDEDRVQTTNTFGSVVAKAIVICKQWSNPSDVAWSKLMLRNTVMY